MSSEILFRSDEVIVHYEPRESDTLLIAFGHMGMVGSTKIWAADLAAGMGWSFIGLSPLRATWYPKVGFADIPDSVEAICRSHRRRIAYGGSMGGYGAVRWAKLFAATITIAGAPQISIDPEDIAAFDKRWKHFFNAELNEGCAITSEDIVADTFVLADPRDKEDWAQACAVSCLSDRVKVFRVPNTAHAPLNAVAGLKIFGGFVELLERGELEAAHRLMSGHRRRSHVRMACLVVATWLRRPIFAKTLLHRLEKITSNLLLGEINWRIGLIYEGRKEFDESLRYFQFAVAQHDLEMYRAAIKRVIASGARDQARTSGSLLLENLPDPNSTISVSNKSSRTIPTPMLEPKSPVSYVGSLASPALTSSLNLPANVVIRGDVEANTVIVEPSGRHSNLIIELRGKGNVVIIRQNCTLNAMLIAAGGARIEIGECTSMHGVLVSATDGGIFTVGKRCQFLENVRIYPSDGYAIFDEEAGRRINMPRSVIISDDVLIGEYTDISKNCLVGSGSVVEKAAALDGNYPDNALISGNPAKVIRTGIRWSVPNSMGIAPS